MTTSPPEISQLIRSDRRSIALIVERDGRLVVRAPLKTTLWKIQNFVAEKEAWIREKQAKMLALPPLPPPKAFLPGELFWYLGQTYPLEISTAGKKQFSFTDRFYITEKALPKARPLFTAWYHAQARRVFTERAEWFAARHGYEYNRIRLSWARTTWGSCNSAGVLSFAWRLVMAPLDVIDYVVVHELEHLRLRNHSALFWIHVQLILPDYRQRKAWLSQHSAQLSL